MTPLGKLAKWWFSNVGKDAENAAKDTQTKIAVLKVTKMGINSLGPAGGGPYVQMALGGTCTANDISVYKPNIYLYPEEKTQIDVSFAYPDLLTVSDPAYGEGWTVEAEPDGRLYADGGEYGFLFYESRTKKSLYQFDEGYMIPAEDREKAFEGILRGYGLNDKEIADFNAFWCDKLDKEADYAMYPQLKETVDAAMPVTVTPAPDSRLRLWFAFVKDARPERTAVPTAFEKKGYSMTEWGGFIVKTAG